ncbi:protein rep [Cryobacterium zongtaii]|nr:protein rep [Cryobacterium zongtaii]
MDNEIPMRLRESKSHDGAIRRYVSYGNLSRCGSVWACPHCAQVVAAKRRQEIQAIASTWIAKGMPVLFLTLTMRHKGNERLDDLWDAKQEAWARVQKGYAFKSLKTQLGLTGFICATEVTYGPPQIGGKGWHVHLHVLLFMTQAIVEEEEFEARRVRIFQDWAAALSNMGLESPALNNQKGKPLGADLRAVRALDGIQNYFKKNAYLSSVDRISYELSSGNTSKKGRGERRKNKTPLQLFQAMIEDEGKRCPSERLWFDLPGRRADLRTKVTFEGDNRFLLHNPNRVGEVLADIGVLRTYLDPDSGEVWDRGEIFVEEMPRLKRHAAWFEFQTVVFGYESLTAPGKRPRTRQQITRSQRKAPRTRPLTFAEQLWNTALDAVGHGLTDEEIVQQHRGGFDHALISAASWRNVLASDNEAQVALQEALESSDAEALRVAEELGIDLRIIGQDQPGITEPDESDLQRQKVLREIRLAEMRDMNTRMAAREKARGRNRSAASESA